MRLGCYLLLTQIGRIARLLCLVGIQQPLRALDRLVGDRSNHSFLLD